jgi:hypothetical protein
MAEGGLNEGRLRGSGWRSAVPATETLTGFVTPPDRPAARRIDLDFPGLRHFDVEGEPQKTSGCCSILNGMMLQPLPATQVVTCHRGCVVKETPEHPADG